MDEERTTTVCLNNPALDCNSDLCRLFGFCDSIVNMTALIKGISYAEAVALLKTNPEEKEAAQKWFIEAIVYTNLEGECWQSQRRG